MLQNDRRYLLQSESISQELMLNWYDCTEEAFHCVDSFTESARYSSDREQVRGPSILIDLIASAL